MTTEEMTTLQATVLTWRTTAADYTDETDNRWEGSPLTADTRYAQSAAYVNCADRLQEIIDHYTEEAEVAEDEARVPAGWLKADAQRLLTTPEA